MELRRAVSGAILVSLLLGAPGPHAWAALARVRAVASGTPRGSVPSISPARLGFLGAAPGSRATPAVLPFAGRAAAAASLPAALPPLAARPDARAAAAPGAESAAESAARLAAPGADAQRRDDAESRSAEQSRRFDGTAESETESDAVPALPGADVSAGLARPGSLPARLRQAAIEQRPARPDVREPQLRGFTDWVVDVLMPGDGGVARGFSPDGFLRRLFGPRKTAQEQADEIPENDAPAQAPTLETLARTRRIPESELPALRAKIERVQTAINMVGGAVGRDVKMRWEPGDLWAHFPEENKATYPFEDLITHSEEQLIGLVDHEGLHRDATRLDTRYPLARKYAQDPTKHLLWNAFEDPRINNWGIQRMPGSERYLHAAYDRYLPKDWRAPLGVNGQAGLPGAKGDGASAFDPSALRYPHWEFLMAANYYWRHGQPPPRFINKSAREAFEKARPDIDAVFRDNPEFSDASEQQKTAHTLSALQRIDEKLLPLYEPLLKESQDKLSRDLKNQKDGKGKEGKKGQQGKDGKGQGAPPTMPPQDQKKQDEKKGGGQKKEGEEKKEDQDGDGQGRSEKDDDAKEQDRKKDGSGDEDEKGSKEEREEDGASGGDEEQDGSKDARPRDAKSDKEALEQLRKHAERAAKELAPKLKDRPSNRDAAQARKDALKNLKSGGASSPLTLEEAARVQREQRANRQLDAYERAFAPVAHLSSQMVSYLENIFNKNSRPRDVGYYRTGKRPDVKRYMKRQGEGSVRADYMLRRVEKTKRRYKVTLLVDGSASMADIGAVYDAIRATVLLVDSLARLGIDTEVMLFWGGARVSKEFSTPLSPEMKDALAADLLRYVGTGDSTHDGDALRLAVSRIAAESAERKFVIVISDGGRTGGEAVASVLPYAARERVDVLGVGIGAGMAYVKDIYPRHVLVDRIEQLPMVLRDRLEEYIDAAERGLPLTGASVAPQAALVAGSPAAAASDAGDLASRLSRRALKEALAAAESAKGPDAALAHRHLREALDRRAGGAAPAAAFTPLNRRALSRRVVGALAVGQLSLIIIMHLLAPLGAPGMVAYSLLWLAAYFTLLNNGGITGNLLGSLSFQLIAGLSGFGIFHALGWQPAYLYALPLTAALSFINLETLEQRLLERRVKRIALAPDQVMEHIPALERLASQDRDPALRRAATEALGTAADDERARAALRRLLDSDEPQNAAAAQALERVAQGAASSSIAAIEAAPDLSAATRARAEAELEALKDRPELASRLRAEELKKSLAALELGRGGPDEGLLERRLLDLLDAPAGGAEPAAAFQRWNERRVALASAALSLAVVLAVVALLGLHAPIGRPWLLLALPLSAAGLLSVLKGGRAAQIIGSQIMIASWFYLFLALPGAEGAWSALFSLPLGWALNLERVHAALLPLSPALAREVKAASPDSAPGLTGVRFQRARTISKLEPREIQAALQALALLARQDPDRGVRRAAMESIASIADWEDSASRLLSDLRLAGDVDDRAEAVALYQAAKLARLSSSPAGRSSLDSSLTRAYVLLDALEGRRDLASRVRREALRQAVDTLARARGADEEALAERRLKELLDQAAGGAAPSAAFGLNTQRGTAFLERYVPSWLASYLTQVYNVLAVLAVAITPTVLFPELMAGLKTALFLGAIFFYLLTNKNQQNNPQAQKRNRFLFLGAVVGMSAALVAPSANQDLPIGVMAFLIGLMGFTLAGKVAEGRLEAYGQPNWRFRNILLKNRPDTKGGARLKWWTRALLGTALSRERALREMMAQPAAARPMASLLGQLVLYRHHDKNIHVPVGEIIGLLESMDSTEADKVLTQIAEQDEKAFREQANAALERRREAENLPLAQLSKPTPPTEEQALRARVADELARLDQPQAALSDRLRRDALRAALAELDVAMGDERKAARRRLRDLLDGRRGGAPAAAFSGRAWTTGAFATAGAALLTGLLPGLLLLWTLSPLAAGAAGLATAGAAALQLRRSPDFRNPQVQLGPEQESASLPEWIAPQRALAELATRAGASPGPRLGLALETGATPSEQLSGNAFAGGVDLSPRSYVAIGERWLSQPREIMEAAMAHELGHLATGELAARARWAMLHGLASLFAPLGAFVAFLSGAEASRTRALRLAGVGAAHLLLLPLLAGSGLWLTLYLLGNALALASCLLDQAVSRRNELRADAFAARLVGVPATEAFLDAIELFSGGQDGGPLNSHPSLKHRRANVRSLARAGAS